MKYIYSIHHYLGTFFFFLFLIWFLSGFVMMYKSFPTITHADILNIEVNHTLDASTFLEPKKVFNEDGVDGIRDFKIKYLLDNPVYELTSLDGTILSKYAKSGIFIKIDSKYAEKLAIKATNIKDSFEVETLKELDQWVPRTNFLKHLPIYIVEFNDNNSTRVYVSSLNGDILSLTTISDRFWAWVGAIPHWIYFKNIRIHTDFWALLVIWLSALGFLMALTGVITGLVRYKKKPKANFKRFKNRWYNLHYYFGLIFGLFVCTWVFSGLMSMSPFNWTPSTQLNKQDKLKWQGEILTLNSFSGTNWSSFVENMNDVNCKEIDFSLFNKQLFAQIYSNNESKLVSLNTSKSIPEIKDYRNIIKSLNQSDSIVSSIVLNKYDNYYYSRHNDKVLPVIRITTNSNLAYYINPTSTEVLYKCANKNRIQRWLYNGLHSLDFSFLTSNGLLWDIVVLILMFGGTIVSVTATGLGIKFIRRKIRKGARRKK